MRWFLMFLAKFGLFMLVNYVDAVAEIVSITSVFKCTVLSRCHFIAVATGAVQKKE